MSSYNLQTTSVHFWDRFWLNRLYEALYPPYHAFGSISDLALSTIPEAVKALSIVKDWVRTLVYKREISPATNFLTDVMRTTTLALTFDRSQASYLRNAAYFRAPTPHMYIRRGGCPILPELLGVMSGSYTWSLSAGFVFVEQVMFSVHPCVCFDFFFLGTLSHNNYLST